MTDIAYIVVYTFLQNTVTYPMTAQAIACTMYAVVHAHAYTVASSECTSVSTTIYVIKYTTNIKSQAVVGIIS